jgi:non-heme chloroperoxidase
MFNKHIAKSLDGYDISYSLNKSIERIKKCKLPLLVFNYGLVCNNAHWQEQLPYFDNLGYPILIHDYRLHYESALQAPIESLTFENIALDLHEILKTLGHPKVFMLGHSMGVNVTLEYAHRFESSTLGMVLISGTVIPPHDIMFDTNVMELATPTIQWVTRTFPSIFSEVWKSSHKNPVLQSLIHRGGFNKKTVPKEFVEHYLKKIGELEPEVFHQLFSEMKKHNIIGKLESISAPSLVIGGDKDKVIPNYLQEILHSRLKQSKLYIIKDGSHVPQVDFPKNINERIELFFNNTLST